jgi:hypothetical protein
MLQGSPGAEDEKFVSSSPLYFWGEQKIYFSSHEKIQRAKEYFWGAWEKLFFGG